MAHDAHRAADRAPFEVLKVQRAAVRADVPAVWLRALRDVGRRYVRDVTSFALAGGFYFLSTTASGRDDANHKVLKNACLDFATLSTSGAYVGRFTARVENVVVVRGTAPSDAIDDDDDDVPTITMIDTVVFDATHSVDELRESDRHFVFCAGAPGNYQCELVNWVLVVPQTDLELHPTGIFQRCPQSSKRSRNTSQQCRPIDFEALTYTRPAASTQRKRGRNEVGE